MTIQEALTQTGLPVRYSHFKTPKSLPYIVYIGDGQNTFPADNTFYDRHNLYQVEYYFNKKDEAAENALEQALLDSGFFYEKSADAYIEDQDIFLIYYSVWTHKGAQA